MKGKKESHGMLPMNQPLPLDRCEEPRSGAPLCIFNIKIPLLNTTTSIVRTQVGYGDNSDLLTLLQGFVGCPHLMQIRCAFFSDSSTQSFGARKVELTKPMNSAELSQLET
jgi:hypothetical protein